MGFDNWQDFGTGEFEEGPGTTGSLAEVVLDTFNIPHGVVNGGWLSGIDIKNTDAMSVIQASLFEELANGNHLELVNDENGEIKTVEVGGGSASLSDEYFSAQSFAFRSTVAGVMVTGKTPHPKRKLGNPEELLTPKFNYKIWDDAHFLSSQCTMPEIRQMCTITYDDPHLSTAYEDGIDNFYDVTDPYTNVLGYAYIINRGNLATQDTEISFSSRATVPLDAGSSVGDLITPEYPPPEYANRSGDCVRGLGTPNNKYSISVPIPRAIRESALRGTTVPKFSGVTGLYIIGVKVSYWITPASIADALKTPNSSNTLLWVDAVDFNQDVVALEVGKHYTIGYPATSGAPSEINIALAENTVYGMQGLGIFGDSKTLYFAAGPLPRATGTNKIIATILPLDDKEAIIVDQILLAVDVDTPSINIKDPAGNALDIAEDLSVKIQPIILTQEPAPVSFNGGSVDLAGGAADNDPTTTQNFNSTPYEDSLEEMTAGGAGMSFTLSSLSQGEANSLSSKIKAIYDQDTGITTIHTCGPGFNPHGVNLGDSSPGGGVINSIESRYTDSNSYTHSIMSGPTSSNSKFASLSGNTYFKKSEEVTAKGTVIQDAGNGSMFKVMVDGIGPRKAINCCSEVIRNGDRVSVTIHNNPVES